MMHEMAGCEAPLAIRYVGALHGECLGLVVGDRCL